MNLKTYLLTRMLTLGVLCWILISGLVIVRTSQEVRHALVSDGERLREMVEYSMYKRQMAPEIEGTPQLLGSQYGLLLAPYCVRYEGWNGQVRQEGCSDTPANPLAETAMRVLGLDDLPRATEVGLWGQAFGELTIRPDANLVLQKFWTTLQDLLFLMTLTLGSLGVLSYIVIGRAFRPAATLVNALDSIAIANNTAEGSSPPGQLPDLQPREFGLIAKGINRLSERLWKLSHARSELMRRLLKVQEEERRDLAHLVHADLGQSLSLIALNCAQLRRPIQGKDEGQRLEQLEQIEELIENAFEQMRAVLVNKCPPVLDGANLGMAIQDLCTRWKMLAGHPWQLEHELDPTALTALDKDQALCVYRTIEESLVNAQKHGSPTRPIRINLSLRNARMVLAISNAIRSHAASATTYSGGMGLALLAERVRVYGGDWTVSKTPDSFEIQAQFKVESAAL